MHPGLSSIIFVVEIKFVLLYGLRPCCRAPICPQHGISCCSFVFLAEWLWYLLGQRQNLKPRCGHLSVLDIL